MSLTIGGEEVAETVRGVFETLEGPVYVLDPPLRFLRPLVETLRGFARAPSTLRVLGDGTALREFRADFTAAAAAADLVDDSTLDFRIDTGESATPVIASRDAAFLPVVAGDVVATVGTGESALTTATVDHCEARWTRGEPFSLRTPSLSTVRESLAETFGPTMRTDFDTAVATVRDGHDPTDFDPVLVTLLLGGVHEILHYDVSRWGSNVGIASRATYSRKKRRLEDLDVLTTERVPVKSGRPRQRLLLTDEYRHYLKEAGIAGLVDDVLA